MLNKCPLVVGLLCIVFQQELVFGTFRTGAHAASRCVDVGHIALQEALFRSLSVAPAAPIIHIHRLHLSMLLTKNNVVDRFFMVQYFHFRQDRRGSHALQRCAVGPNRRQSDGSSSA